MTSLGILVCGAFEQELMQGYGGVYEDFFIDALLEADPDLSFITYAAYKDIIPTSIIQCDAWLVTGSKHGVYENLPWMLKLQEFLKEAYAANIPLVGICFGHQILAQALGGHVEKSDAGWGLGHIEYDLLEPFAGLEGKMGLHAIHQDQVVKLPPEAGVFAKTDHCPHAGLIYKNKAVSIQPHPEFSQAFERDLITFKKGNVLPNDLADQAILKLDGATDHNKEVMAFIADFIKG
ncbi:type 1 glutamine amidotransferase [Terasakiella sp. A23]|uniref:type 1 glutamine amidotransferase n=1 Tax=Terasakiella sp. FCG-A23 TaxID=3080561 RepID=UPI0029549EF9|nr:type 1 glutamine amidotransferase [Terasakiella sp. A23]MDV7338582.1 type 1 glutamine amidotransferase [Terasakiella sp. A23]